MKKITSRNKDGHLDDINYIESAGTWSPNSKQFAFTAVRKGQNIIVIKDALTAKTVEEFEIKGVPAFSNPAWSPDGKSIVVSGLVNGQVDLYQVGLKKKKNPPNCPFGFDAWGNFNDFQFRIKLIWELLTLIQPIL